MRTLSTPTSPSLQARRLATAAAAIAALLPLAGRGHEPHPRPPTQLPAEVRQKATVCSDNKGHFVVVTPNEPDSQRYIEVFYGDGKQLFPSLPYQNQTHTLFRDPRFYNSRAPAPERYGRSVDYRLLSGVKVEDGKCSAWCGERDIPLTVVDAKQVQAAQVAQNPRRFAHHALARDEDGTYYYVDHGYFSDTVKNYRVFVGPKRGLKEAGVVDVVSDSEGDVFTTKAGNLLLNKSGAKWKAGGKVLPLAVLSLDEATEDGVKNLLMIYNEFGLYRGERLGTPCDVL